MRQNIAGWCQQTFCFQNFVDNAQQCFACTPQTNFPAHSLNFHWRWWDRLQAIFLNHFYFNPMTPKTYRVHLITKVLICSSFKNFNSSKFNFSTVVVRLLTKKLTDSSKSSVFLRLISFNATHLLQIPWIDSKLRIGYCSQILDSG